MELLLFILIFIFLLIVVVAITDTIEKCSYYKWKSKSHNEFSDKESEDKNAKLEVDKKGR